MCIRDSARTLLPVRKLGHQALSTLVLGNMWCNVMIAQFGSDLNPEGGGEESGESSGLGGLIAFVVSTLLILVFTEIMPMSICKSQRALEIAAKGVPILRIFIVLFYPVAKPLGWLLDTIIPHDIGQIYDRNELKKLMAMHTEQHAAEAGMDSDEGTLIIGALEFAEKLVSEIMTPIEKMYCVRGDRIIDRALVQELWRVGYSRIPVIDCGEGGDNDNTASNFNHHKNTHLTVDQKQHVVGILYLKDLITHHPAVGPDLEESLTVIDFIRQRVEREVQNVYSEAKLPTVMKLVQSGIAHLLLVREKPVSREHVTNFSSKNPTSGSPREATDITLLLGRVVGVVTIEDVIEALLRAPIYDEGDSDADQEMQQVMDASPLLDAVARQQHKKTAKVNMYEMYLHPTIPQRTEALSDAQLWSLAHFLSFALPCFAYWRTARVRALLEEAEDLRIVPPAEYVDAIRHSEEGHAATTTITSPNANVGTSPVAAVAAAPHHHHKFLQDAPSDCVLYRAGEASSDFCLVLHGGIELSLGKEELRSELSVMCFAGESLLQRTEEDISKRCKRSGAASTDSIMNSAITSFQPNFSARVRVPSRILRIPAKVFARHCVAAIQNITVQGGSGTKPRKIINRPPLPGGASNDQSTTNNNTKAPVPPVELKGSTMANESKREYDPTEEAT
eukprot:TRINITY_DN5711_c0_g1_i1.p1 TRINITY_DN5711_c0_g1~~TRINITY_DN5711_c0_g1_i1.p1  ORF type:complete len:689 (+),score=172.17 TRINITY_DN5711_c0_g1_i1:41-2068(+)